MNGSNPVSHYMMLLTMAVGAQNDLGGQQTFARKMT